MHLLDPDPRSLDETAEDWRRAVAVRHAELPGWKAHLREAGRCMRAAGLWPWTNEREP